LQWQAELEFVTACRRKIFDNHQQAAKHHHEKREK
jgi:hypothetical protein